MVDWGAGTYETTAAELAPVAQAVVERAAVAPGEHVVDSACGTGNAALLAAAAGARVVGVDAAPRLLEVARERARAQGLDVEFREGDLLALPLGDDVADEVLSVFGVIFAPDPSRALGEVARILRPGGRALLTAWTPAGPIDAMVSAMGQIVARVTSASPQARFPWADPDAVGPLAAQAGLVLVDTTPGELPIRAASPEAYVAESQSHPMALAVRPVVAQAGVEDELAETAIAILREANEDPDALLVHTPYVVHEIRHA